MNQRTCLGTSYLDLAKGAAESFLKIRARDSNVSRGDRYMLVTYDEPTKSVKAGWRENLLTFQKELKSLAGNSMSNFGQALKDTFDLLNMHRLQSGIDNYGMGRNPYYVEPTLVLLFTDGCSMLDIGGIIPEITFPTHNALPGSELTTEMYRWDQRLFSLNIRIPGFASSVTDTSIAPQPEDIPLGNLCEQTGGKLYNIVTQKTLMQSMESIAQKIMIPGVMISFDKYGPDPEPLPKEGVNNENVEHDKGKENIEAHDNVDPIKKLDAMQPPMINGFIPPPMFLENDLTNGVFPGPNEVPKVLNGLLPTPLMPPMPLIPPMPLPPGMPPGTPLRGILPPPPPCPAGFLGLPRPPLIPFVPNNPNPMVSLPPNELPPPPMIPSLANGPMQDGDGQKEIKTEGDVSKGQVIPDVPIRGDENSGECNGIANIQTSMSTAWQNQRRMIYVKTNVKGTVGHWPIPESFYTDPNATKLPARSSHPIVNFTCASTEAMAIENMPFDKYELEPSPLTQYILERKQPNVAWQTFVPGSSPDSELGYPFGYIKAATNLQTVNFFVLPYHYTLIMPLLDELFKVHKCKPTPQWRLKFDEYLKTIPNYYATPLRNALRRMGAPQNLIPDHMDGAMSYSVVSYLKKVKHQAKLEAERLTNLHSNPHPIEPPKIKIPPVPTFFDGKSIDFKQLLIQKSPSMLNKELLSKKAEKIKISESEPFPAFIDSGIPLLVDKFRIQGFKNPFDIRRDDVLQQAARMRTNFFHMDTVCSRLHEEDSKHNISILEMGNYQEHVSQNKPLREVDPSQARVHTFGNPFKLKQDQLAVDEADLNDNMVFGGGPKKRSGDPMNNQHGNKNKRRTNATPPPSRRPIGAPNSPQPPKPPTNPQEVICLDTISKTDDSNCKHSLDDLDDETTDENEATIPNGNIKDGAKNSIDEQLKRLIVRNRKNVHAINEKTNTKLDELTSSTSPILSILQTSLEDMDEKDNEELAMINEKESKIDVSKFLNTATTSPTLSFRNHVRTPPDKNKFRSPTPIEARLELQSSLSTRVRLEVWKAIRNRSEFKKICELLGQLTVSDVARNLFIKDIIAEADRFQLTRLTESLRTLITSSITSSIEVVTSR